MTFEEWYDVNSKTYWTIEAALVAWKKHQQQQLLLQQQQRIDKLEKALLEAADIIDTNTNFHALAETLRILSQEEE